MDAGLPTAEQLTHELRSSLSSEPGFNGNLRPVFERLFDNISQIDPISGKSYERFFEWLELLRKIQILLFSLVIKGNFDRALLSAAVELPDFIRRPIIRLLKSHIKSPAYKPEYLGNFKKFLDKSIPLEVFTINYDCCVEDACRSANINITTGFDPATGYWNPSLFKYQHGGIILHKLHGSLSWAFDDNSGSPALREVYPPICVKLPELVLGPGKKLQDDDPFVTLFYRFRKALRLAKVCIIIGYGHNDDHINTTLREANDRGMRIIEVSRSEQMIFYNKHKYLKMTAKCALESGAIVNAIRPRRKTTTS